ncbi:Hsp20/alpha crystallin family protein [Desulfogranum marinum]|jgi:HSP20 family protein|uniref:Hsp20/alpha crystallin family protein n=1 Tax=Desulfogranum marinum TaxID=453220 RepID=UPI0019623E12|nr:Hsp20/alpha crystallin family protein [Desulfogranum marinum]MBM9513446.1 Hsp20/alpha crystallin family protein [Desulfogranum marinum]
MPIIRFAERAPFRNPWAEFERIRQGLDELSKNYGDRGRQQERSNVFPALNIYEQDDRLIVTAEIPGVSNQDLDISVEGETLTLKGKRENAVAKDTPVSYHRREIESGTFSRAVALPVKIDLDNLSARLIDGILTITLPKAAKATPRKIQILSE